MTERRTRITRIAAIAATPLAVLLAGGLVYQASFASFSAQTRNSGNEWSTGTINLTDDDAGRARFAATDLTPGQTETACIAVTADATVPSTVRGYVLNATESTGGHLEDHIFLTVEGGSGGSFDSCDGFEKSEDILPGRVSLAELYAFTDYESGIGGWPVDTGAESRTYRFTWEFDVTGESQAAIDAMQGQKTGLDFQWEMKTDAAEVG